MPGRLSLTDTGTGFVVAALLIGVLAHVAAVPALLYVSGLLVALVLAASALAWLGLSGIGVDRTVAPEVLEPGQPGTVSLAVRSKSRLVGDRVLWSDRLATPLDGTAKGVVRAPMQIRYTIGSNVRGEHQVGPLNLAVSDPFQLAKCRRRVDSTSVVTVLPRRWALPHVGLGGVAEDGAAMVTTQQIAAGSDDVVARPYRPGDALKRMHWRATAHRGELMVREVELRTSPRVTIVLDLDAAALTDSVEWAISAAASVTSHLVTEGFTVALRSHDGQLFHTVADAEARLSEAMVALARCGVSERAINIESPDSLVVVIGGKLTADRAEVLRDQLTSAAVVLALVSVRTEPQVVESLQATGWKIASYGVSSQRNSQRNGTELAAMWAQLGNSGVENRGVDGR